MKLDSSDRSEVQGTKPRPVGVFWLGERVKKGVQQLSSLTCVTYILLRHGHAWIFGGNARILRHGTSSLCQ